MLGRGIYQLTQVSKLTGVAPSTVRAWFLPRPDGKGRGPIFESDYESKEIDGDYAVSFLNLIDTYVARFFKKYKVPPDVIRKAHTILQERLDTRHPFAHADLRTNGRRIIERDMAERGDAVMVDVVSGQQWFGDMAGVQAEIDYDEVTRIATVWRIRPGVQIRPGVNFGQPAIEKSAVPTLTVARQYRANGGDAAFVAKLFNISPESVLRAYEFELSFGRIAA
jgi:uncharacterized protein (DUF433 family)